MKNVEEDITDEEAMEMLRQYQAFESAVVILIIAVVVLAGIVWKLLSN